MYGHFKPHQNKNQVAPISSKFGKAGRKTLLRFNFNRSVLTRFGQTSVRIGMRFGHFSFGVRFECT